MGTGSLGEVPHLPNMTRKEQTGTGPEEARQGGTLNALKLTFDLITAYQSLPQLNM